MTNPKASDIESQLAISLEAMRRILIKARRAKLYCLLAHHFSLFISAFWSIYTVAQLSRTEYLHAISGFFAAIVGWQIAQFFRRQAIGYTEFILEADADMRRIIKKCKTDILKP